MGGRDQDDDGAGEAPDAEALTWRELDWSDWEDTDVVGWREIHPEVPAQRYDLDGRTYEASDNYCLATGCECGEVSVLFHEIVVDEEADDEAEDEAMVGIVWMELESRERVGTRNLPGQRDLLERLWAAYVEGRDLSELDRRDAEMQRIAPEIYELRDLHTPPEPLRRGPKVGRNDPCPCGSGRKYKKCCGI